MFYFVRANICKDVLHIDLMTVARGSVDRLRSFPIPIHFLLKYASIQYLKIITQMRDTGIAEP